MKILPTNFGALSFPLTAFTLLLMMTFEETRKKWNPFQEEALKLGVHVYMGDKYISFIS